MHTAKQVINNALEAALIDNWADDYAEPGYNLAKGQGGILFADWNPRSFAKDASKADRLMLRLSAIAERAGYACEWSDEWMTCTHCGRAVRCSPDCYSWRQSYWADNGEITCAGCTRTDETIRADYLEWLEELGNRADMFDLDLEAEGYIKVKGEMEHGYHPGQNDSPEVVSKALIARGIHRFVFQIDDVAQFDVEFSAWVHRDELPKLGDAPIDSALDWSPAEEMRKALKGVLGIALLKESAS